MVLAARQSPSGRVDDRIAPKYLEKRAVLPYRLHGGIGLIKIGRIEYRRSAWRPRTDRHLVPLRNYRSWIPPASGCDEAKTQKHIGNQKFSENRGSAESVRLLIHPVLFLYASNLFSFALFHFKLIADSQMVAIGRPAALPLFLSAFNMHPRFSYHRLLITPDLI